MVRLTNCNYKLDVSRNVGESDIRWIRIMQNWRSKILLNFPCRICLESHVSVDEVSILFREHCFVTYGRWSGLPIVTINWTFREMWAKVILGGYV